jgi:hypothetical protein
MSDEEFEQLGRECSEAVARVKAAQLALANAQADLRDAMEDSRLAHAKYQIMYNRRCRSRKDTTDE